MTRIGYHGRMSCSTTGRVDTDRIFHITTHQSERIVIPQVLLGGKRNLTDIRYCVEVIWGES